jgi:hypothetical protein
MTEPTLATTLISLGFTDGWALSGDVLILWEHDEEPPAPLVRPQETTDEALTANADTGNSAD